MTTIKSAFGRAGDPDIYEYDTEVIEASHGGECGCRSACTLDLEIGPHDAEFIANAREDVAWLLDRAEHLDRELGGSMTIIALLLERLGGTVTITDAEILGYDQFGAIERTEPVEGGLTLTYRRTDV